MRRITLWLFGTIAVVALLFSYRTSTLGGSSAAATVAPPTGKPFDGKLVRTKFGPVQVRITVADGKITDIVLVAVPGGTARTDQISQAALPTLRAQALSAQSAEIDTVSGATATSAGYRKSLQAAIDNARHG
jgi:uncharacterized protein with FMN-binding domain